MVGNLSIIDQTRGTHIRFRNMDYFESNIIAIDEGSGGEDALFNGYIHKINTLQFNSVSRFQYGKSFDFQHQIIEY